MSERDVVSNWGQRPGIGWWWGVWQDGVLVGFGDGYRRKERCFRHERDCKAVAQRQQMPRLECRNPVIQPRETKRSGAQQAQPGA
jgi:hypothetical protein